LLRRIEAMIGRTAGLRFGHFPQEVQWPNRRPYIPSLTAALGRQRVEPFRLPPSELFRGPIPPAAAAAFASKAMRRILAASWRLFGDWALRSALHPAVSY
jgi:hypothetical protein